MRKRPFFLLISLLVLMASMQSQAQNLPDTAQNKNSTMEISGTGRMKVVPDETIVQIQVSATNSEAGRAVKQATDRVDLVLRKLKSAGFSEDEIRTSQFFLNEQFDWRDGTRISQGYQAAQQLEVRFGNNPEQMTRLTKALSDMEEGVTFSFGFGLSEAKQKEVRDELIRKAMQDARDKAQLIARSAGLQLGGIRHIRYGAPEFRPMPYEAMEMRMQAADASMAKTPVKELEMEDQISVLWYIQ